MTLEIHPERVIVFSVVYHLLASISSRFAEAA